MFKDAMIGGDNSKTRSPFGVQWQSYRHFMLVNYDSRVVPA